MAGKLELQAPVELAVQAEAFRVLLRRLVAPVVPVARGALLTLVVWLVTTEQLELFLTHTQQDQ